MYACASNIYVVFNQNISDKPEIKSFILNIDEDEYRQKQKGIKVKKNSVKLKEMLPQEDTIEINENEIDYNVVQDVYNLQADAEDQDMDNFTFEENDKIYLANKYIGVYNGKFGILTKKQELSTK